MTNREKYFHAVRSDAFQCYTGTLVFLKWKLRYVSENHCYEEGSMWFDEKPWIMMGEYYSNEEIFEEWLNEEAKNDQ